VLAGIGRHDANRASFRCRHVLRPFGGLPFGVWNALDTFFTRTHYILISIGRNLALSGSASKSSLRFPDSILDRADGDQLP
jgi:hypothetical protein